MTVLVVGATGMTGRALVEQLLSKGHTVRAGSLSFVASWASVHSPSSQHWLILAWSTS